MQFGSTIGKACLTFAITNIDDAFVLVTFFAEASASKSLKPFQIILGQYIGFTVIVVISLIGFAVAVALPSEPIGFLGLLPILIGVWKFFGLLFPSKEDIEGEQSESRHIANAKSVLKVAIITIMNGGDNIGVYVPLFSQAKGAEVAVYVVVYYILLGVWCLIAFSIMKQRHILQFAAQYAAFIVPFLFIGLGIYIVVKSDCYPWSIDEINNSFLGNPGKTALGIVTALLLSFIMGFMVWLKLRNRSKTLAEGEEVATIAKISEGTKPDDEGVVSSNLANNKHVASSVTEQLGNDQGEVAPRPNRQTPNAAQSPSESRSAVEGDEIQIANKNGGTKDRSVHFRERQA